MNFNPIGGIAINLTYHSTNLDENLAKNVLLQRAKTLTKKAEICISNKKITIKLPGFFDSSSIDPLLWSDGDFGILEARSASNYIPRFLKINDSIKHRIENQLNGSNHPDGISRFIDFIQFNLDYNNEPLNNPILGYVKTTDTSMFSEFIKANPSLIDKNDKTIFGKELAINDVIYIPIYIVNADTSRFTNEMVENFSQSKTTHSYNQYSLLIELKPEYHPVWEEFTQQNIKKFVAVLINNQVYICPMVQGAIPNGKLMIPLKSIEDVKLLKAVLSYNLPKANLELVDFTETTK